MLPRLGCLFIVVPLIELALLIQVGRWVGVWPTVGIVALTGVAGAALVRREGIRTLARVQGELARGTLPGRSLMDGACLLVGGALLVTPGVLTDVLAFALLFGPTRRRIQDRVSARVRDAMRRGTLEVRMGSWPGGGAQDATRRPPRDDDPPRPPRDDDDPPRPPRPGEIVQE